MIAADKQALAGDFLLALDLLGTFVFALSGAVAGVKNRLDLFGLMVLAFAAGNAGGITRDLLIGSVPPGAISDWRYLDVSLLAGVVVFFWYPDVNKRSRLILLLDGAGLALFAVTGTQKALAAGLTPDGGFDGYADWHWRRGVARRAGQSDACGPSG